MTPDDRAGDISPPSRFARRLDRRTPPATYTAMGSFTLPRIVKMRSRASSFLECCGPSPLPPDAKAAAPREVTGDDDSDASSIGLGILSTASTPSSITSVAGNLSPIDFDFVGMPLLAEQRPIPKRVDAGPLPALRTAAAGPPVRPRTIDAPPNGTSSGLMENFRPVVEIGQESDGGDTGPTVEVLEGIHSFQSGGPCAVSIYLYGDEGKKRVRAA